MQFDNRYAPKEGDVFGESWGQFFYDDADQDLHAGVDFALRGSSRPHDNRQALYQAYLEKGWAGIDSRLKLGRFQRTDNLGFYLLDGATYLYQPKQTPYAVEVYAGRPSRIDHVRTIEGDYLAGFEARAGWRPEWRWENVPVTLDKVDVRGGYQHFEKKDDASERLNFAVNAEGQFYLGAARNYQAALSGTYRLEKSALENIWFWGQADLTDRLRFRTSYEEYRPRDPFPTFRERFYTAYALGEQTLWRGSFHYTPVSRFTYFLGGQQATRGRGDTGYGGQGGASWNDYDNGLQLSGEYDYITLGADRAHSFYLSAGKTLNSRTRIKLNTAIRFEDKQLYGENRALGAEAEFHYMIKNNILMFVTGSYIDNTRIPDEYLGAVQVIYYFDNFKPKTM